MTAPAPKPAPAAKATPAKKAPATVTAIDGNAAAMAAAKEAHPAAAAKAPTKSARTLGTPAELTWEAKTFKGTNYQMAVGKRHTYRVSQGESCFGEQKLTANGKWVGLAGACTTEEEAKKLAGWCEAGATWLSYTNVLGTSFAALVDTYGDAK